MGVVPGRRSFLKYVWACVQKDTLAIKADKMIRVLRGGNIGEDQFYFKGDDVFISSELVKPELYLRCGALY